MKVYIGFDHYEAEAARVAVKTLHETSGMGAELLSAPRLADAGLLWRITDHRGGQPYDLISNAPKSTAFAISRFLVPLLCQGGLALFTDCDVVFLRDPREMEIDTRFAVSVVKHDFTPRSRVKMVDKIQTTYPRKNWSSVMVFNCDHPANHRLSLHDVNTRPGRDLHRFYWLHDSEIGALAPAWNWLVNEQPRPADLGIAHFTNGGPWLRGWVPHDHDDLWLAAARATKKPALGGLREVAAAV